MVIGKPHLEKHRTGASTEGDKAGQLKVLFRQHVAESVFVATDGNLTPPLIVVQVKLFESGLVTPKKVLGITDEDGVVGCNDEYYGSAAWAGEVGQPVTQPVQGIADTLAGKSIDRHGRHSKCKGLERLLKSQPETPVTQLP
jgi:hypothetical protein